jgi:hypothetical protein
MFAIRHIVVNGAQLLIWVVKIIWRQVIGISLNSFLLIKRPPDYDLLCPPQTEMSRKVASIIKIETVGITIITTPKNPWSVAFFK